jgi:hypothetical protein
VAKTWISDRVGILLEGSLVAAGPIEDLAQQSLGLDQQRHTLEEIYMRYFRHEAVAATA